MIDSFKSKFHYNKQIGAIIADNSIPFIATYLAALQGEQVPILLSSKTQPAVLEHFLKNYQLHWLLLPTELAHESAIEGQYECYWQDFGHRLLANKHVTSINVYPDLAILLSTSGTTGNPKLVRLSYQNLKANAESIATYLRLSPSERPITNLPLHYSYGLSILNSHLAVGAPILLTNQALTERAFWQFAKEKAFSSLAGVPYTYQMLRKFRFNTMHLPSIRYLTQAGGKILEDDLNYFTEWSYAKGIPLYVMYGQTEATARMSYLPSEQLQKRKGSIGVAIPNGALFIDPASKELIYEGPNVMLGYAEHQQDLTLGDVMHGVLKTGDLAVQDTDGYFYITGRLKRFAKLYGLRINLDDVENFFHSVLSQDVVCISDDESLFIFSTEPLTPELAMIVAKYLDIDPRIVVLKTAEETFRNTNGKVAYQKYMELL